MRNHLFLIGLLVCLPVFLSAQDQSYRIGLVGFYNFENLFDTLDTPDVRDTEFTPEGGKLYGTRIYNEKLGNLSRVVSEVGTDLSPDGLAVLGVAEVENRRVLEDFVLQPAIADRNYQIVHYDSPDERGIDVALLYNPKYFTVSDSKAYPLELFDNSGDPDYTRDILLVSGTFDGEPMHFLVNHWPSRSGGQAASQSRRAAAAVLCKSIVDSLQMENPNCKVVIMGDLNDDPISPSVRKGLEAKGKQGQVRKGGLFNPMFEPFKKGNGSNAYNGAWNLFDQIIISESMLDQDQPGYFYHLAQIYRAPYLFQRTGRYKGFPLRTFSGDLYIGGYSDHLPVFMVLLKRV